MWRGSSRCEGANDPLGVCVCVCVCVQIFTMIKICPEKGVVSGADIAIPLWEPRSGAMGRRRSLWTLEAVLQHDLRPGPVTGQVGLSDAQRKVRIRAGVSGHLGSKCLQR